jgi:hypothetical protein
MTRRNTYTHKELSQSYSLPPETEIANTSLTDFKLFNDSVSIAKVILN